jgi:hypothetical protein
MVLVLVIVWMRLGKYLEQTILLIDYKKFSLFADIEGFVFI